jgi:hypothetical protein
VRPVLAGLAAAQSATGAPLILGLNLGRNDPSLAVNFASAAQAGLPGGTFDGSADGRPLGAPQSETATPAGGAYTAELPPATAALLTVAP